MATFLVLASEGAFVVTPASGPAMREHYDVLHAPELRAGDLVGSWSRLTTGAPRVARASAQAIRLDNAAHSVDWKHLAVDAEDLVLAHAAPGS